MVESKHVFLSIIAAIVSALIAIPIVLSILGNIDELIREIIITQLSSQGVSQDVINATLARIGGIVKMIVFIAPISQVIQAALFGAIMGLLYGFLISRFRLKPVISALITGISYIIVFYVIPILYLYRTQVEVFNVISKYIWWPLTMLPPAIYSVVLIIFSAFRGPWSRWVEAGPSKY